MEYNLYSKMRISRLESCPIVLSVQRISYFFLEQYIYKSPTGVVLMILQLYGYLKKDSIEKPMDFFIKLLVIK